MAKINLNEADVDELSEIPGIGEEKANDIIEFRDQHGDFTSWDDLKQIPGFSDRMIQDLKKAGATIEEED